MLGNLLNGRYQVLQVLGGGGFGQTYVAQDTHRPGSPKCVVKHLQPITHNPEFLQTARRLFNSEAETLEKLGNHSQIPRLLAYFEDHQEFFLVQDFIVGHPLKVELIPGQRWGEAAVIQLLHQLLTVLEFIHSKNVIHRDIKPENIIRKQEDGNLVLIDFGAVKHVQSQLLVSQGYTSTTIAIGTPGYMSIEQGRGKPRPNSDIYSLGIIAIQALTGLHPKQLEDDQNTGEIHWQHQAQVSPGLAAIVSKMVLYNCIQRYQSATEVLQAIQKLGTPMEEQLTQLSPTSVSKQQATVPFSTNISVEQYNYLTKILSDLMGSVAPTLLRQLATSANSYEELVERLQIHLIGEKQIEFKQKALYAHTAAMTKNQSATQNLSNQYQTFPPTHLPQINTSFQAINDSFVTKCQKELASVIGPIATFLVQKAVKSSPGISQTDLVKRLAAEIPDPQKAVQFQQRLLNLT